MAEGQYKFSIGLDDKQLDLDIQQAKKAFDDLVKAARDAGANIDNSFKNPFEGLTPPTDLPQRTQAVAQSFNGLNMATQQLVRELPAASMGLNTLFLAMSNNLPIFADQIKQVSAANEQLRAQGKPTVSVIKQIIGSLFSWQTALVLGVTALTMYGKEIGNWIAGLFKGKKTVDAAKEAQEGLNKAISEGGLGIQDEIRAYERLRREWTALNGGLKEQEQFINDNRDAFDKLGVAVNDVRDAERLFVDNTEDFLEAMRLRAEATAAEKLAVEQYEKAFVKQRELEEKRKSAEAMSDYVDAGAQYARTRTGVVQTGRRYVENEAKRAALEEVATLEQEVTAIRSVADAYYDVADAKRKAASDTLKDAGITGTIGNSAAQREAEARARRIATLTKQLAADAEREATQAKIDAMAEGINKELAQIDHDYDLREQKIREREEQLKEARGGYLTESDMAGFNALREASRAERDRARASAYSFLDSTEEDIFGDTDKAMAEATERLREEQSKRSKAWEDYIIAYGTFQERLLGTAHKYNRLIAEAETEGERMALEAERDAILAEYEVQASTWAQELVDKTTEQLNAMIEELQAQVDAKQAAFDALDNSGSDDAKKYREEINRLNAQIKVLQQQLGKAKKDIGDDNWADATQVFQNISQAANDAAEGIAEFDEGAASVLRTMAQLAGTAINLIGAIQAVTTAASAAAGTISTMEKASVILAVIGAVIQAVSVLINLFKGSNEVAETMRQFKELNAELERFRKLAQIDSVEGTIFGEDAFGNFSNNLRVMREAFDELEGSRKNIQEYRYNKRKEYLEYLLAYNAHTIQDEAILLRELEKLEQSGLKDSTLSDAIGAIQVQLGKRRWSTLGEQYPELFAGGEVSLEGLRKLKESDLWEKISQENRALIDELIADWELYEEATAAVNDHLKNIFGELGQEINDAIVDAFINGTDAAEAFGDVAGKVMENLIKQIGYTAYIAPILSKAMADVEALNGQNLSAEDYLNALMGIVGDTMKAAEDAVDGYNEYLERSDQMADEQGINAFDSERSGAAKGIAQASQDSVDDLNGRMTAVQSHTFALVEGQKRLINDSAQILRHLAGIESNTAELRQMRVDMSAMRSDISDMATRGVIMR